MTFQVELIRILLEEQLLLVLRADAPTLGYAEVLLSVAIENQTKTTSLLEGVNQELYFFRHEEFVYLELVDTVNFLNEQLSKIKGKQLTLRGRSLTGKSKLSNTQSIWLSLIFDKWKELGLRLNQLTSATVKKTIQQMQYRYFNHGTTSNNDLDNDMKSKEGNAINKLNHQNKCENSAGYDIFIETAEVALKEFDACLYQARSDMFYGNGYVRLAYAKYHKEMLQKQHELRKQEENKEYSQEEKINSFGQSDDSSSTHEKNRTISEEVYNKSPSLEASEDPFHFSSGSLPENANSWLCKDFIQLASLTKSPSQQRTSRSENDESDSLFETDNMQPLELDSSPLFNLPTPSPPSASPPSSSSSPPPSSSYSVSSSSKTSTTIHSCSKDNLEEDVDFNPSLYGYEKSIFMNEHCRRLSHLYFVISQSEKIIKNAKLKFRKDKLKNKIDKESYSEILQSHLKSYHRHFNELVKFIKIKYFNYRGLVIGDANSNKDIEKVGKGGKYDHMKVSIKQALAISLASLLSFIHPIRTRAPQSYWAAVTISFILVDEGKGLGASVSIGEVRLLGTTLGSIYGLLCVTFIYGDKWSDSIALSLLLGIWVFATSLFRGHPAKGYAAVVAGFTAAIIVHGGNLLQKLERDSNNFVEDDSDDHNEDNYNLDRGTLALYRIVMNVLGVGIFIFIEMLIWPKSARTLIDNEQMLILKAISESVKNVMSPFLKIVSSASTSSSSSVQVQSSQTSPLFGPRRTQVSPSYMQETSYVMEDNINNTLSNINESGSLKDNKKVDQNLKELQSNLDLDHINELSSHDVMKKKDENDDDTRTITISGLSSLMSSITNSFSLILAADDEPQLWRCHFPKSDFIKLIDKESKIFDLLSLLHEASQDACISSLVSNNPTSSVLPLTVPPAMVLFSLHVCQATQETSIHWADAQQYIKNHHRINPPETKSLDSMNELKDQLQSLNNIELINRKSEEDINGNDNVSNEEDVSGGVSQDNEQVNDSFSAATNVATPYLQLQHSTAQSLLDQRNVLIDLNLIKLFIPPQPQSSILGWMTTCLLCQELALELSEVGGRMRKVITKQSPIS